MEIFNVVLDPHLMMEVIGDEDDDETEYCDPPPGPLIMVFTSYLVLKQASPRNYVNWLEITDSDGQAMETYVQTKRKKPTKRFCIEHGEDTEICGFSLSLTGS